MQQRGALPAAPALPLGRGEVPVREERLDPLEIAGATRAEEHRAARLRPPLLLPLLPLPLLLPLHLLLLPPPLLRLLPLLAPPLLLRLLLRLALQALRLLLLLLRELLRHRLRGLVRRLVGGARGGRVEPPLRHVRAEVAPRRLLPRLEALRVLRGGGERGRRLRSREDRGVLRELADVAEGDAVVVLSVGAADVPLAGRRLVAAHHVEGHRRHREVLHREVRRRSVAEDAHELHEHVHEGLHLIRLGGWVWRGGGCVSAARGGGPSAGPRQQKPRRSAAAWRRRGRGGRGAAARARTSHRYRVPAVALAEDLGADLAGHEPRERDPQLLKALLRVPLLVARRVELEGQAPVRRPHRGHVRIHGDAQDARCVFEAHRTHPSARESVRRRGSRHDSV